jgi:bisphosphoglycerate-independent phosphoglycerate mutase (AlkP superfamily)
MAIAKVFDPGFSTADAEYPDIRMEEGDLVLRFKDWRGEEIEAFFSDVIAFKWQMIETFSEGEEYDRSHEILHSEWLAAHVAQSCIAETEEYKHYKFNFNGCGQLEVLANGFIKKT